MLVVWPELNPILFGNLNRLAHNVGFSVLFAAIDGPFAILGPTVLPGLTACFECAQTRVLDAMRDHTVYTDYRKHLAEGRVYGHLTKAMNPFQATLGAMAGWEVQSLLRTGSAFTCDKLLTVYGPTMEIMFHELLMVPGCPVCGPKVGLDAPLYADLQAFLTSRLDRKSSAS